MTHIKKKLLSLLIHLLCFFLIFLGRAACGARGAGAAGAGGQREEYGRAAQRSQLQTAFSPTQSARK